MALNDFKFLKYDPTIIGHIQRHLDNNIIGSHFDSKLFPNPKSIVDLCLTLIEGLGEKGDEYRGQVKVFEITLPFLVGYDALVSIDELPSNIKIEKCIRGENEGLINIVEGIPKKPTNKLIAIIGPLEDGKHGFYTIYPGTYASPLPLTEEEIKERELKGESLVILNERNKEYQDFWDKHALIR